MKSPETERIEASARPAPINQQPVSPAPPKKKGPGRAIGFLALVLIVCGMLSPDGVKDLLDRTLTSQVGVGFSAIGLVLLFVYFVKKG